MKALVYIAAVLLATQAIAASYVWTGSVSGDVGDTNNWSPKALPSAADSADLTGTNSPPRWPTGGVCRAGTVTMNHDALDTVFAEINGGTWTGTVTNYGCQIFDGVFSNSVYLARDPGDYGSSAIYGGTFQGTVTLDGLINYGYVGGGTFNSNVVSTYGSVGDGTFNGPVSADGGYMAVANGVFRGDVTFYGGGVDVTHSSVRFYGALLGDTLNTGGRHATGRCRLRAEALAGDGTTTPSRTRGPGLCRYTSREGCSTCRPSGEEMGRGWCRP